jgi:hypothetical protein
MVKRLLVGLLKGLVLGGAVGAVFHFALGWPVTPGWSGYLIAMGTGATAGTLAGRPPWRREAWLEGIVKATVGLAVGLGLHWLARRFLAGGIPLALGDAPEGTPWTDLPLLFAPAVGAVFGTLVELDNTSERPTLKPQREKP